MYFVWDDASVANHLYEAVRVLCYVPVAEDARLTGYVNNIQTTWGKHCNKIVFFASSNHTEHSSVVGLGKNTFVYYY